MSIYRQYFEPIQGVTEKVACNILVKGIKCGAKIKSKKASNLQAHVHDVHNELYQTIQASPKAAIPSNQSTLDNFAVSTPGKSSDSMRDLLMYYATSTAPINDLSNPHLKVDFLSFSSLLMNFRSF